MDIVLMPWFCNGTSLFSVVIVSTLVTIGPTTPTVSHRGLASFVQAHEHGDTGAEDVQVEQTDTRCAAERARVRQGEREVGWDMDQ